MSGSSGAMTVPAGGGVLALKEWAAAVHALLQGRQTVLLRKGGIHEKRFTVRGSAFVVFPTVAHSHAESTRSEFSDLLAAGRPDVTETAVVVRAALSVVDIIPVRRAERIAELEPFHIWTTESVKANRIDFRPKHELTAIVVRASPLAEPITVPLLPEYAGCKSWIDLQLPTRYELLDPVLDDATLLDVVTRVRAAVTEIEEHPGGRPVARSVPNAANSRRSFGHDPGKFVVPDDWNAPLPAEVLESFE